MSELKTATGDSRSEKRRRSPKKLDHIEIAHAKNGGHIVRHQFVRKSSDGYPMHEEPEEHVFGPSDGKNAMKHVAHHMGIKVEIGPVKGGDEHEPDDADDGDEPDEE